MRSPSSVAVSQSSSIPLQTSLAVGCTEPFPSSQSSPQWVPLQQLAQVYPSLSASRVPIVVGSQSSSRPSHVSAAAGWIVARPSSQSSPPHETAKCVSPSASRVHVRSQRSATSSQTSDGVHGAAPGVQLPSAAHDSTPLQNA